LKSRDRRGRRDRMELPVQSVHITTKVVSSNPVHVERGVKYHIPKPLI